jgi:hypothetical protein
MFRRNSTCSLIVRLSLLLAVSGASIPTWGQRAGASARTRAGLSEPLKMSAADAAANPPRAIGLNGQPIDEYVKSIPPVPMLQAVSPHVTEQGTPENMGIVNRRRQLCQTNKYSQTTMFEEIAALDPNTASIYPGALVQGATLSSGRFTEIALPRGPTTLTVTGLAVSGPNVVLSAPVAQPTLASVQEAVNRIVADPASIAPQGLARMNLQVAQVHSFEQALLDAGVSASWLGGSFSARLKTVTTSKKNSVIVKFNQIYYEVNAKGLALPSEAFGAGVTLDQVKAVAYPADPQSSRPLNPPLMVKTVKYGRMAILAIASDAKASDLEFAVRAGFNAVASTGEFTLDVQSRQILEQSTFDGVVVGGAAGTGAGLLSSVAAGNLTGLKTFLTEGATYNPQTSPAAPISYVLTYLDNRVADSSFSADFSLTGCTDTAVPIERIRVGWNVGDDDKDQEMYPYIIIRDRNGRIVANSGGEGRVWASTLVTVFGHTVRANMVWDDNNSYGPFEVPVLGQWSLHECEGSTAEVGQRSSNGEDPEWHTTFYIDVRIDGKWYTIRGPSPNKSEFRWGDGKPDSTVTGLACPSL